MRVALAVPTLVLAAFAGGVAVGRRAPAPAPARAFELRTYHAAPGKLPALQQRFRAHTLGLFARHGMTNVGYWTPQDTAGARNTLVYLLAYPSRDAARRSWAAFGADPEWRRVHAASEAGGPLVDRIESVFLDPTDYSPLR